MPPSTNDKARFRHWRTYENVASYYAGSTPNTGTVVIEIGSTPNVMLMGEVEIQGYNGLTTCNFRGYTYTGSTTWHMPDATCLGSGVNGAYSVRFGKRADNNARVILIGTTTSNWGNYPHVTIPRVTYGSPSAGTTATGDWSISMVTNESPYTSIVSVNANDGFQAFNPIFNGNVGIGTSSPTYKLDVAGKVGATHYCDASGNNCLAAGNLGGIKEITLMNPYAVSTRATAAHNLGAAPSSVTFYLENKVAEYGYSVGDRVYVTNGAATQRGFTMFGDVTNVGVSTHGTTDLLTYKNSATSNPFTASRWKLVAVVTG